MFGSGIGKSLLVPGGLLLMQRQGALAPDPLEARRPLRHDRVMGHGHRRLTFVWRGCWCMHREGGTGASKEPVCESRIQFHQR